MKTTETDQRPEYCQAISKLRDELGFTQNELGFRLGVSGITVARWEGGQREPDKWAFTGMLLMTPREPPDLRSWFEARIGRTYEQIRDDVLGPKIPVRFRRHVEIISRGAEILAEQAAAGSSYAEQMLQQAAEEIEKWAGHAARLGEKRPKGK